MTAAAVGRLVTITKIRVDNLPLPWSAGWETRYFKVVISCAGLRLGETLPEELTTDGCIEWVEPLQLSTRGRNESLVGIVVSSRHLGGDSWCQVPGCRFECSLLELGHSVWRQPLARDGAGPILQANVETVFEGDDGPEGADNPGTLIEGDKNQVVGGYLETLTKGGKAQGESGHVEAASAGNKPHGSDEHLETLPEDGGSPGSDGRPVKLLQGDKGQETVEGLNTLLQTHKRRSTAHYLETIVDGYGSQEDVTDLETVVGGDYIQAVAERLQTRLKGSKRERYGGHLEALVAGDNTQGTADHVGMFLAGDTRHRTSRQLETFVHWAADPPPTSGQETQEAQFDPFNDDSDDTDQPQTVFVSERDPNSPKWGREAGKGRIWLHQHERSTSTLAYDRVSKYATSLPARRPRLWALKSTSVRNRNKISAVGSDSNAYERSSVRQIDNIKPESASPSLIPRLEKHVVPHQRTDRGRPNPSSASALRSSSSGGSLSPVHGAVGSLVPHGAGPQPFVYLFSTNSYRANTPSRMSYGLTQDSRGMPGWGGLAGGGLATEEKGLVAVYGRGWYGGHTSRIPSWMQQETQSESTASPADSSPSVELGEKNAAPRLQRGAYFPQAANPQSGKLRHNSVHTSPTVAHLTAPTSSTAPPSYEEATRVEREEAESSAADFLPPPEVEQGARSPLLASFRHFPDVEVEGVSHLLTPSPYFMGSDSPPPSYDSMFRLTHVYSPGHVLTRRGNAFSALPEAEVNDVTAVTNNRLLRRDYRGDGLASSSMDSTKGLTSTGTLTKLESHTTGNRAHVQNTSDEVSFYAGRVVQPVESSSVEIRGPSGSASRVAAVARDPSPEAVEATPCPQALMVQPSETPTNIEHTDPIYFTCVSPRSVWGECDFQLRVSASSRQVQDILAQTVWRKKAEEDVTTSGVPGAMRIARGKTVTVKLELPENVFKILDPDSGGASEAATNHPSSVRDFVWDGNGQEANFNVTCLPGVTPGAVDCSVCLIQSGSSMRLSFSIEVVEAEVSPCSSECGDGVAMDTALGEVEGSIEEDDPSEATISDAEREPDPIAGEDVAGPGVPTRPSVVCLAPPYLLASRVHPGTSVHESKEHGFRLTVQDGSLHSPIGPITLQSFAQVVKCENNGHDYLLKIVVDCLPSGAKFPDKPLLMDFRIEDACSSDLSETVQVLVRKGEAGRWRTIKSGVRVDQWGTYLRAEVSHFCRFTWGTKINSSDPARLESCNKKGVIEAQNATEDEIYFVLVPVSFDSDKTSRVTYTGNISFGVAGLSFGAAGGSSYESAVKSHMLPAGFIPDEISVPAGGKVQFLPPPGAAQGKLLVATITEECQAGLSVKVIVLHGKLNTPEGKRRVILPICLKSKSRISARLGPNDIPVEMVMIMAGMGPKTATITEAPSPPSSTASVAPPSTVSPVFVPPRSAQSQGNTTRGCPIS